jgi:hypothetical protein
VTIAQRLPGPKPPTAGISAARGGAVPQRPGNSCNAFEEIAALDALGRLNRPHLLRLARPIFGRRQLPLYRESEMPPEIIRQHHDPAPPPPIHVYGIPGHELGGGGFLQQNGQIFQTPDVMPAYYGAYLRDGGEPLPEIWQGATFRDADIIEVDQPVAVAIHPNVVYGHFLLEMLPRLHLLSRLRRAGLPFLIALHFHIPDWAKAIVRHYFDADEIIWYDGYTTRLRAPCFVVPSMMQVECRFHPEFNLAIDEIKDFVASGTEPATDKKIWLSRQRHPGATHGITNEGEVEQVVTDLGYRIVHPQTMSFPEQILLMSGADVIAGAYTSAIHNSMFAARGTKVFCINRLNRYQSGIAALRSQPLGHHLLDPARYSAGPIRGIAPGWYDVDRAALRDDLRRFEDWQP